MTPLSAWNAINHFLPTGKIIWEPFFGDGTSGKNLMKLGHRVVHQKKDFFKYQPEYDLIVTNPPYSIVKDIMPRLLELDKPFVLLMPSSKINTQYMREWSDKGLQIIIPRKRIQFIKCTINKFGCIEPNEVQDNKCNFDCFYYCYKMNLPRDMVWLDDDGKGEIKPKVVPKKKKIKLIPSPPPTPEPEPEPEPEIAFNCFTCKKPIIRNSEDHDHSKCDPYEEDNWYCPHCPVPASDDEDSDDESDI